MRSNKRISVDRTPYHRRHASFSSTRVGKNWGKKRARTMRYTFYAMCHIDIMRISLCEQEHHKNYHIIQFILVFRNIFYNKMLCIDMVRMCITLLKSYTKNEYLYVFIRRYICILSCSAVFLFHLFWRFQCIDSNSQGGGDRQNEREEDRERNEEICWIAHRSVSLGENAIRIGWIYRNIDELNCDDNKHCSFELWVMFIHLICVVFACEYSWCVRVGWSSF